MLGIGGGGKTGGLSPRREGLEGGARAAVLGTLTAGFCTIEVVATDKNFKIVLLKLSYKFFST